MQWTAEAKVKDLATLTWYTYEGDRSVTLGSGKEYNQKHPLTVRPGELVGMKQATRGSGVGNYQVVLGHALHVLFRSVPEAQINKLIKKLVKYKGKTPEHNQLLDGQKRVKKVTISDKVQSDKQTDDLFKPTGTIRENTMYDRTNYQWRKIIHPGVKVKSLKQGRSKYTTQEGDIIGLRYMTKARGGFVILPNEQRVNISHDTYMELVNSARIQPTSKQQKGLVILADLKAGQPKQTRIRKPKEPVIAPRDPIAPKSPSRVKRDMHEDLVSDHDIDDDEIEDDEDIHELPLDEPEVPKSHQPSQVLKVGAKIGSSKRPSNQFVVVDATKHEGYTEFALYSPTKKDVRKLRLADGVDMASYKSVSVLGEATKSELAAGKRAFNGAVKNKKFTTASIHD